MADFEKNGWCQGFLDGFLAAFALKTGHPEWEKLRDEYLFRRSLLQPPEHLTPTNHTGGRNGND